MFSYLFHNSRTICQKLIHITFHISDNWVDLRYWDVDDMACWLQQVLVPDFFVQGLPQLPQSLLFFLLHVFIWFWKECNLRVWESCFVLNRSPTFFRNAPPLSASYGSLKSRRFFFASAIASLYIGSVSGSVFLTCRILWIISFKPSRIALCWPLAFSIVLLMSLCCFSLISLKQFVSPPPPCAPKRTFSPLFLGRSDPMPD